jgi:hypothetical protein
MALGPMRTGRVSYWPGRAAGLAWSRMDWQDRIAAWLDRQVAGHPALDRWLEAHLHAIGLHGPAVRHLLKTRVVPAATVVMAALLLMIALGMLRRARRRRRKRGLAGRTVRPASSGSGR